jgi:protein-S-isoprenylcysteine O-methyltransferase Ste14
MSNATGLLIACCWAAWLLIWVVMAFRTKQTAERGGFFGYRLVGLIAFVLVAAVGRLGGLTAHSTFWHLTAAIGIPASVLVLAGGAFSVWARVTLGRNWSAEVTFKRGHELVESGPYRFARHPIYTGIIAMALGTAIDYGRAIGFAVFLSLCGAFWWKARQEEAIMSRHFPGEYADYRARVRAIIPYVL